MAIQGVDNAYYSSTAKANEKRQVGDELGKDAFLQILVAQMANQDPLSPTSDTEFIAQMAQFSSLEQMQNLNASMSTQAAYSYMGKDVTSEFAMDTEGNLHSQSVYGSVIGVSHFNGGNYLQVQDYATGEIVLVAPDQVLQTINKDPMQNQMNQLLSMMSQVVANTERSAAAAESAAEQSAPVVEGTTETGDAVTEDEADVETPVVSDAPEAPEADSSGEAVSEDSAAL